MILNSIDLLKNLLRCFNFSIFLILFFFFGSANATSIYVVLSSKELEKVDAVLDMPCIDGVSVYWGWSKIEPEEGRFNYSDIRKLIESAKAKNKKVNLAILPGRWSPTWLLDKEIEKIRWIHKDSYTENGEASAQIAPVPWDPVYRIYFDRMIKNFAQNVELGDVVNSIAITGGSNTNGIEANLIAQNSELFRIGYSEKIYTENWKSLFRIYAQSFPDTKLTFAVHDIFGTTRNQSASMNLVRFGIANFGEYFLPTAFAFTEERWFRPGNSYADLVLDSKAPGGFGLQALRVYGPSKKKEFLSMMVKAVDLKAQWIEVWLSDIVFGNLVCKKVE